MLTWKVVLVVIAIALFLMAIGMWLGYRYISEQDDIHYEARNELLYTKFPFGHAHLSSDNSTKLIYLTFQDHSYLYL